MKNKAIIILLIFIINKSEAKFNKSLDKKNVTIKYSGFNNENIEYDLESKSILAADKNSPLNKYFRSSDYSKVNYIDFNNDQYESKDFKNWNKVEPSEIIIQVENKTMNNQEINLNVYPNPTLDMFSVNLKSKSETNISLILNDVTNETRIELVRISNFKGDFNKTFNCNELGLVRGVYFITLQTNQGIILKRFIKI